MTSGHRADESSETRRGAAFGAGAKAAPGSGSGRAAGFEGRPFVPSDAGPAEWSALHVYRRARHAEASPDEPFSPDEVYEAQLKRPNLRSDMSFFTAWRGSDVLGWCEAGTLKRSSPEYATNGHIAWIDGGVLAGARRQGIGTELIEHAVRTVAESGQSVITSYTHEADGRAFLEAIGARCKQVERESRLLWRDIDWDLMARWEAELVERSPGTRVEHYLGEMPEDFLKEYCAARTELMNLMPWDDMDHGEIVITPDDVRERCERQAMAGTQHHTVLAREPDGRIVAITDVAWLPHGPHVVHQWFTGVHPDARGRGIGKAIKAAMVRILNDRYDSLEWMSTGNSTTNAPMLAINQRMGFREHQRWSVYQIDRAALQTRLGIGGETPKG